MKLGDTPIEIVNNLSTLVGAAIPILGCDIRSPIKAPLVMLAEHVINEFLKEYK